MNAKEELIEELRNGLEYNIITSDEVLQLVNEKKQTADQASEGGPKVDPEKIYGNATEKAAEIEKTKHKEEKSRKINAADVLFFIGGLVLYGALMAALVPYWSDTNSGMRVILTLGVGLAIWAITYMLDNGDEEGSTNQGLVNSFLFTGSLSIISGGFIISSEIFVFENQEALSGAMVLLALGLLHLGFDRVINKTLLAVMGAFLVVGSFPVAVSSILSNVAETVVDLWGLTWIASSYLFFLIGKALSDPNKGRGELMGSFSSIAFFFALLSAYTMTFASDLAIIWQIAVVGMIYVGYSLSISQKSRRYLVTSTLFLVLIVFNVSYRYFSGLGISVSLLLAAVAILGSASLAVNINNRYIKQ
jgi:hypothetical protein